MKLILLSKTLDSVSAKYDKNQIFDLDIRSAALYLTLSEDGEIPIYLQIEINHSGIIQKELH